MATKRKKEKRKKRKIERKKEKERKKKERKTKRIKKKERKIALHWFELETSGSRSKASNYMPPGDWWQLHSISAYLILSLQCYCIVLSSFDPMKSFIKTHVLVVFSIYLTYILNIHGHIIHTFLTLICLLVIMPPFKPNEHGLP